MIIIKNARVYNPEPQGKKDVVIAGEKIIAIDEMINITGLDMKIIDAKGKVAVPGFIDSHVHICGGGGEGGYSTRTPEIHLTDATTSGVTTIVGVLGTDGTSRTMSNLLAKAYALEEEGLSTFVYTGSYQVPVRTVTGNITDDLILIEKIIGIGEIALSDHRSSWPTVDEFLRLSSQSRLGGMLSGKSGIINIHMGDQKNPMDLLYEAIEKSTIPIKQFYPTHMNRNPWIMNEAAAYASRGGFVDFTASTTPEFIKEGEIYCADAVKAMLDEGVDIAQITLSSDGQGSLPVFDSKGNLIGLDIGRCASLLKALKEMHGTANLPLEIALKTVTSSPADILKLSQKGYLKIGYDADLLLLDQHDLDIECVISRGKIMVGNAEVKAKGIFQ